MPIILIGAGIYRASGIGNTLAAATHPDYEFAFDSETTLFTGDLDSLVWIVTRKDGDTPGTPISAEVRIWERDGTLADTLTPDLDPAPPDGAIVAAALWSVPAPGPYLAQITLTLPGDGQVRSARQTLLVE